MGHYQKQRDDSLMPGVTHTLKLEYFSTLMYKSLMIKNGKKKALIDLGWVTTCLTDSTIDQYYNEVKPKQAVLRMGDLKVGDKFYVCRTKEKGVVVGAVAGSFVPVNLTYSKREFMPTIGLHLHVQARVKFLRQTQG